MNLLSVFLDLLGQWRPAFIRSQTFAHARLHAFAFIWLFTRKTITNIIIALGLDQLDHSFHYRLYNAFKWNSHDLFNPLLKRALPFCPGDFIAVAADDTRLPKTGKKIPLAAWHRDPLGPRFQVNLIWGVRFLQFSLLVPVYRNVRDVFSARALPIRFEAAPGVKKPRRNASAQELDHYRKARKEFGLCAVFCQQVRLLRQALDDLGQASRRLLMVVDGSFCNEACMTMAIEGVHVLGRTRKNARLKLRHRGGGQRFYAQESFTPEEYRQKNRGKETVRQFCYAGDCRRVKYLEEREVYWPGVTKRQPLRLIVIAPIPYMRAGKRNYRDAAYLLSTDRESRVEALIQSYLDRWQIEVNFREEKTMLGVGGAQVWKEEAVKRQPALGVAAYGALLLAGLIVYGDRPHVKAGTEPKWRRAPKRMTLRRLRGLLRQEVLEKPQILHGTQLGITEIACLLTKAA